MSEKILVTGSSGFIGSHLVNRLSEKKEFEVVKLDRTKYPLVTQSNLSDVLNGVFAIVHLGGVTRGLDIEITSANLNSTILLLDAIRDLKRKPHFIFASSFAVYESSDKLLSEHNLLYPRNIYGLSKKWAEEAINLSQKTSGYCATILRFANVYGKGILPNRHSVVANFVERIKNDEEIQISGDGSQKRDFVHVDDVVDAIIAALLRTEVSYEVFNICSGFGTSMVELADQIGSIMNKKVKKEFIPSGVPDGDWIGENSKAKSKLHWNPRIAINDGLCELAL